MSDVLQGYRKSEVGVILDGFKMINVDALSVDWKKLEGQVCVF